MRKAYRRAGIPPGRVQYIEAHGTGTPTGDPVELKALGAVLAEGRSKGETCLVGSVKTNIGHTEGAAGVAGLIKLALSLKHREIPASLNCHTPSSLIPWETLPVKIPVDKTPWPHRGYPRIGGVSSFGITGTNAHVVLQEALPVSPSRFENEGVSRVPVARKCLFPVSARSLEALMERVRGLDAWLKMAENGLRSHALKTFAQPLPSNGIISTTG